MKNLIVILGLISMMALAACKDTVGDPDTNAPSSDNAALQLYFKYAEEPNLTVAYMGDFCLNGNKIDALMIQADNDEDWKQLKLDFGMSPKYDSLCIDDADSNLMVQPDNKKVVSVGVGIDTDFIEELGLDNITDLSQVTEEQYNQMIAIIAGKISDIMNSFSIPDTALPSDAIIVGQGPLQMADDADINTLAQAIGSAMLNEVIAKNTGAENEENDRADDYLRVDSTMMDARNYGHNGYVSAADVANRTIWLFFYDDQEECNNILTHIKDDILVGSSSEVN